MVETVEATANCPLCGDGVDLSDKVAESAPERVLANREKWPRLSREFRKQCSVHAASVALSIDEELAREILLFMCTDLCGCRRVTCTSCFDDYRSEL